MVATLVVHLWAHQVRFRKRYKKCTYGSPPSIKFPQLDRVLCVVIVGLRFGSPAGPQLGCAQGINFSFELHLSSTYANKIGLSSLLDFSCRSVSP